MMTWVIYKTQLRTSQLPSYSMNIDVWIFSEMCTVLEKYVHFKVAIRQFVCKPCGPLEYFLKLWPSGTQHIPANITIHVNSSRSITEYVSRYQEFHSQAKPTNRYSLSRLVRPFCLERTKRPIFRGLSVAIGPADVCSPKGWCRNAVIIEEFPKEDPH